MKSPEQTGSYRWEVLLSLVGVLMLPAGVWGQEIEQFFKNNCANCHSIGGAKKLGPDLRDITKRRERAWLTRFILNPKTMKDSEAEKLVAEYGDKMPPFDITSDYCESILRMIEAESKLDRSQFAGPKAMDQVFTEEDVAKGHEYFVGYSRFAKGGLPCLACHTVQGVSATGGGMLGPDLTHAFNKLGGRSGMNGWLSSPPTATMKPIYKNHPLEEAEINYLIAYLEKAKEGREEVSTARFNFFLIGLAGTAGGFVLFDYLWRRRFRTVRRKLVHGDHEKGNV